MALLAKTALYDPVEAFRYQKLLRHKPSHIPLRPLSNRFWRSPILRRRSGSQESDIALILGNYHSRFALRNLVVDVIEELQIACVPILLAMKPATQLHSTTSDCNIVNDISLSDLMRSLIHQAVQIAQQQQEHLGCAGNVQTERSMARGCAQYFGAQSPEELFQLLEAVLCEIHGKVYLVVDLGVLTPEQQQQQNIDVAAKNHSERVFNWLESFLTFFAEIWERSNHGTALCKPTVKVLLVSYDAFKPVYFDAASQSGHVVRAETEVVTVRARKSRRHIATTPSQRGLNLSKIQQGRKAA